MGDKTRDDDNFQKRGVCVFVGGLLEAEVVAGSNDYGNLPVASILTRAGVLTKVASSTTNATIDVLVNGVIVANEVPIDVVGYTEIAVADAVKYFATGGVIAATVGAVAPAAADFEGDIVLEYIEVDLHTGNYTRHSDIV